MKGHYSSYGDYGDDSRWVTERVTDFEEVDDETYNLLQRASSKYNYTIVEQVMNQQDFIAKTVADYKAFIKAEELKTKKFQEEVERKKQERLLKKRAKTEEQEKQLLANLLAKHGNKG